MEFEVRDPRLFQVIDKDVELEELATGFDIPEGPAWHPYEQHLTFSDAASTKNAMYRWSENDGLAVFRRPSDGANGNAYDPIGRLLSCESNLSGVSRSNLDGSREILVSHYEGKKLNSPNDVVVKRDGSIYFTDPDYGRGDTWYAFPRKKELSFQGVFRLDPEGNSLQLLVDDFEGPNGLCFSVDERQLFICDTERQHIRAFDVMDDGTLTNGLIWAELTGEGRGHPDGMIVDQMGHLFCPGPGGIHVFDTDANCLGVILLQPIWTTNFIWGDSDMRTLYITAAPGLYRLRMKIPGVTPF